MTTVRAQLETALEEAICVMEHSQPHEGGYTHQRLIQAKTALALSKAEPEGCICSDCPVCAVSVRDCQCADEGRKSHSGWGQK